MRSFILLLLLATGALAQSITTPPPKFPAITVNVTVGTQQRPVPGSWYRKTMDISPKFTIDGPSQMLGIPALEATMLIITMDTRAKYTNNDEVYRVHTAETVPLPAAETGARRQFIFAPSKVTYDSYRDSSNIGGYVYKYYVFGLRDPATKALVEFQTNNPPLASFVKTHPEKRAGLLALKAGSKFPADFK